MADVTTAYTLTTPGGTIVFNGGALGDGTDKYWLQTGPQGLRSQLRTPFDPVPFGDGGTSYQTWRGPMFPIFDGIYLIESSNSQALCQELRNDMAVNLEDALDTILSPITGTLSWTPEGQSPLSLAVSYWVTLDDPYGDNFATQSFTFGLYSNASAPS